MWLLLLKLLQECGRCSFRLAQEVAGGGAHQDTERLMAVVLARVLRSVPWMRGIRAAEREMSVCGATHSLSNLNYC